jgi:tetratricopeptide (TPR) repeat protein
MAEAAALTERRNDDERNLMTENPTEMPIARLQQQFDGERAPAEKYRLGMALGDALSAQGKRDQAVAVLRQILDFAPSDHERARALIRLGGIHSKKSDYEAAIADLEQAVVTLSGQPDSLELMDVYLQIATIYWRQGYVERTRSFLDGAKLVMQLRHDDGGPAGVRARAELLHVAAIVEGSTGNQEGAIRNYFEEIGLLESLHDNAKLGTVYNNLSGLYKARGQLAQALDNQLKAMDIAEQAGEPLSIAIACNNLGEIYFALGYQDKALPYYRLYLELNKKIANRMGDAFGHAGLGRIMQSRGEYEKAEREFRTALAVAREVKSRGREAAVLAELADLYCDWGQPERAVAVLDESIQICIEIQLFNTQRHQVINSRILFLEADKLKEPARSQRLRRAQAILDDIVKHPIAVEDEAAISAADLEMECHLLLAQVQRELGDGAAAGRCIAKAVELVNAFAAQFNEEVRRTYLSRAKIVRIIALRDDMLGRSPVDDVR